MPNPFASSNLFPPFSIFFEHGRICSNMPNYKNKILFLTVDKNTSPCTHSYLGQVGRKHFFHKGKGNLNEFFGGTFMKKVFSCR